MNSKWTPPIYGPHNLENHWINLTISSHDQMCGCTEPIIHFLQVINRQNNKTILTAKQLKDIKCQLTGEDTDGGDADLVDSALEDLQTLFDQDGDFPEEEDSG